MKVHIYNNMAFKKLSYYLFNAQVTIICDNASLRKFLPGHTLNSKGNN